MNRQEEIRNAKKILSRSLTSWSNHTTGQDVLVRYTKVLAAALRLALLDPGNELVNAIAVYTTAGATSKMIAKINRLAAEAEAAEKARK